VELGVVVAGLPQIGSPQSYLMEIASISLNELVPLFVRRQNFLNALPDRSAFCAFQVDKTRLSREMATNIQSFGSED
jgi:hypothetical protein